MARRNQAQLLVGMVRRRRARLLRETALQAASAIVFVTQASAQPAPAARPMGGQVVAGSASISQSSTASTSQTTVTQSTPRAAINWQSFDVGSGSTVTFAQPGASAWTLNRVTGPDPSQIAGRISANGSIVLTNPAGVVFHAGSQVNATNLVVSAPGISNENFMAGHLVFDQAPKPGAMVRNAGTITVKDTGLAALVAPGVANSGTINARLGHAVLAGAEAHTIDLYGDGLVSVDVTKAVTQLPRGPDGKPVEALVTNSGTVIADGGTVHITAKAADGIVTNLVQAGGRIQANTVGGQPGRVLVSGVGGSVRVEGQIVAEGGAGQPGGRIAVTSSHAVTVANGARISASAQAGGGTVALGTTLARAAAGRTAALARAKSPGTPRGTARQVIVEQGATVSADGGAGGTVAVLSTERTQIDGALSARGGPSGGDGGVVETSSDGVLNVTQPPDLGAPAGKGGAWFLDPWDLIVATPPQGGTTAQFNAGTQYPNTPLTGTDNTTGSTSYIAPSTLEQASKNGAVTISLATRHDLTVQENVNLAQGSPSIGGATGGASLSLHADNDLNILANITLGTLDPSGNVPALTLDAGNHVNIGPATGTPVTLSGYGTITMTATGPIPGSDPTGGSIAVRAGSVINTGGSIILHATNTIDIGAGAKLTAGARTSYPLAFGDYQTSYYGIDLQAGTNLAVGQGAALTIAPLAETQFPARFWLVAGGNATLGQNVTVQGGDASLTLSAGDSYVRGQNPNAPAANASGLVAIGASDLLTASAVDISSGTGGSVSFADGSQVSLSGSYNTVLVTGGSNGISIGGTLNSGSNGLVSLNAAGDVTEGANGAVVTQYLSGTANSYSLTSRLNAVNQAGGQYDPLQTTAGDITLVDNVALAIGGNSETGGRGVSVPTGRAVSITTDQISIGQDYATGDGYFYAIGPGVSAPGGLFAVQPFSPGKPVELVANIAADPTDLVVYRSDLSNVSASQLQLGSATAGNVVIAADGVGIDLTSAGGGGGFDGLALLSKGTISQVADLAVPSITAAGTEVFLNNVGNQIASVGTSVASAGNFYLSSGAVPLTIAGTITAADGVRTIQLRADKIAVTDGAGLVANSIVFTPVTSGRPIELVQNVESPLKLSITQALIDTITRPTGSQFGVSLQVGTASTPSITVGNPGDIINLNGHVDLLDLTTPGAIIEDPTASLRVSFFYPSVGQGLKPSSVSLPGPNQIGTVHVESNGDIAINDSIASSLIIDVLRSPGSATVTSTGPILVQNTNAPSDGTRDPINAAVVSLTGSSLQLSNNGGSGNALRATQSLSLNSTGGGISQSGLPIITPSLGGVAAGTVALTDSGNQVGTLRDFAVSAGDFALTNSGSLAVAGAVSVPSTQTITLLTDTISYGTGASLSAPSGRVVLAPASARAGFALDSSVAGVTITADTLQIGTIAAGALTIDGAANFSGVKTLDLRSSQSVSEGADGSVQVGTLTGSAASATLLGQNSIGELAGFTTQTGFSLANAQALAVTGAVIGPVINLDVTGDLALSANLTAATSGTVSLNAIGGAISQTAGVITAGSLTGSADSASLTQTNQIASLGPFTTTTSFSLTDGQDLTVAGPVGIGAVSLNVTGALTLASAVTGGTVSLTVKGDITETNGGSLFAGRLTGTAASATLDGMNQVGTLGAFTTGGGFTLVDNGTLTVDRAVSAGAAVTLSSQGPLTVSGDISGSSISLRATRFDPGEGPVRPGDIVQTAGTVAPTLGLSLQADDAIRQTGGVIRAVSLSGSAGGAVDLVSSGNAIVDVLDFAGDTAGGSVSSSVGGGLHLVNGTGLAVLGRVTDTRSIILDVAGGLELRGTLQTPALALNASGAITQPDGALDVTTLSGTAQNVLLNQRTNSVSNLGGFNTSGDFTLTDSHALAVTGPVQVGNGQTLGLSSDSIQIGAEGSLSAAAGTVSLSPFTPFAPFSLTSFAPAGTIVADTLRIGSNVAGNMTIAGAFQLTGINTLDLRSEGAITEQQGGSLIVRNLTGQAGSATLLQPGNQIANLGAFTTSGDFRLYDATGLVVAGPNKAPNFALSSAGSIQLAGDITTGLLAVNADGTVTQTGGTLTAGTLTGTAARLAQFGTAGTANVATLGLMVLTGGTLTLVDSVPLTVTGPLRATNINLSAPGSLTLQGGQITTNAASLSAPILLQTGNTQVMPGTGGIGTLSLTALNGRISLGGLQASGLNLSLTLGSGAASGTLNVAGLAVSGSGGSAGLNGSVAGTTGAPAAAIATITPAVDVAYKLNGCVISTNCGIASPPQAQVITLPTVTLPTDTLPTVAIPLVIGTTFPFDVALITPKGFLETELENSFRPDLFTTELIVSLMRDPIDPNLLLPNISDRDY